MSHSRLAKSIYAGCCILLLQTKTTYAQTTTLPAADTMKMDVQQAEKTFLDHNLQLLAEHYNIQSAQALVEQARKWDNPILMTDQNIYANHSFMRHGKDASGKEQGEVFAQLQQLIKTAGKRGKQIDLARTNVKLAEWQFQGVMRSLRATLLRDFYTVANLQGKAQLYSENMERLNKLLTAQDAALKAGNIAKKEYLRVQALIVSLEHDITDNAKDLNDAESELKTLLQVTGNKFVLPVISETESAAIPEMGILQITDSARHNNPDYQQEVYQLQYNKQNLRLQRALSVPDLTVSPEFDQAANYAPNYFGLSLSLPLPVFDRNQGNIHSADFQVKQEETLLQQADQKLQNDVLNAWQKLVMTARLTSAGNTQFYKDYYQLQKNILESYNSRQINLLEFLEYFNDYADIREKELDQVLNLRLAKQELNETVGTDVAK